MRIADAVMQHPAGIALSELSTVTGLHENTLRDHVRVLLDAGILYAEVEHRGGRGRPRLLYRSAVEEDVENEQNQVRIEDAKRRGDLLRRIAAIDTAELDEDVLHQLDALYEHLDEVGLEPEIDEEALRVEMRPCAFHNIVDGEREVACRVHERLIRDVLRRTGGPVEIDRLLPLVGPHMCALQLRLSAASADAATPDPAPAPGAPSTDA